MFKYRNLLLHFFFYIGTSNTAVPRNEDDMEKEDREDEKDDEDSNQTPLPSSPAVSTTTSKSDDDKCDEKDDKSSADKKFVNFPSTSDINGRLRRLVTCYQRNNRKNDLRNEAKVRVSSTMVRL